MAAQATTTTAAVTSAVISNVQSVEAGIVQLFGSFQGNGGSSPTVFRGGWFSAVTRVSAGLYRVQLNLQLPTLIVAGTPAGLIMEPRAHVVSETITTQPASFFYCSASCLDVTTNKNTFDITTWVLTTAASAGTAGTLVATDVASTDRVFFQLAFKNTAVTP